MLPVALPHPALVSLSAVLYLRPSVALWPIGSVPSVVLSVRPFAGRVAVRFSLLGKWISTEPSAPPALCLLLAADRTTRVRPPLPERPLIKQCLEQLKLYFDNMKTKTPRNQL